MPYTNSQKEFMSLVARGEFTRAQNYLKLMLERVSSESDKAFAERTLKTLDGYKQSTFEIPANLNDILSVEYPGPDNPFQADRYYLSDREQVVAERIEKMNTVAQKLKDKKITYVNSILLYGESGTGKTTFGRYLAYRLNIPFVYLSVVQVMDSLLGKTGQNIMRAFEFVQTRACVFMLDEIDAIGERRGTKGEGASSEMRRIVTALFLAMDKLQNSNIVMGATNRPDIIDEALRTRFRKSHEVKALNSEERAAMIEKYLRGTGYWDEADEARLRHEISAFAQNTNLPPRELETLLIQKLADSEIAEAPLRLA